jgi:D-amino peptidase
MKLYISADIEGVAGVTDRSEIFSGSEEYETARKQMTKEVAAACIGAMDAGITEVLVKDAHDSGRNILAADLPTDVRLLRGWTGHPYSMMEELNDSFGAAMMIGYHDKAGNNGNPLAHTISTRKINKIEINGIAASEFLISALTAGLEKVPVVLISGDQNICKEASKLIPQILAVPVKQGIGSSTVSIHPETACEQIRNAAKQALSTDRFYPALVVPEFFEVQIEYIDFKDAFEASFYPGVRSISAKKVVFESHEYFEVLRMFNFLL